jgi:hypothetical protein
MNFIAEVWQSLTRDQQRMVWIVAGGLFLSLLAYILISGLVALGVAAVYAYLVGRHRARSEAPQSPPEPARAPERHGAPEPQQRPSPQRGVTPRAQTPLGRLFAERPAWSGPPVGPYEPSSRSQRPAPAEDEQLTIPLKEPYDSR